METNGQKDGRTRPIALALTLTWSVMKLCVVHQVGGGQSKSRLERAARAVQRGVGLFLGYRVVYDARVREHSDGSRRLP